MPALTFEDVPFVGEKTKNSKLSVLSFDDVPKIEANQKNKGALTFEDVPFATAIPAKEKVVSKLEYPRLRQFFKPIFEQAPFGKRILATSPERVKYYAETPPPATLSEKVASGLGALIGMTPSFAVGGLAGKAVAGKATLKLLPKLGRLAKYVGAGVGGSTTFTGAKALRNIGQQKPILKNLPEEVAMGAVFGPTGEIRSFLKAVVASTGLGALIAPKGEKLSSAITFGGLTALTHQKPDLTLQDKLTINKLYDEATKQEGIRTTQEKIRGIGQPKLLPAPKEPLIVGETFVAREPTIADFIKGKPAQIGEAKTKLLPFAPNLPKSAIRQGEGFTVIGGKQVARPLARGVAKELRTTPTAEQTIQIVAKQIPAIKEKTKKPQVVSGVVVTKEDLEPISKPTSQTISAPEIEIQQTPTNFYAKIKNNTEWQVAKQKGGVLTRSKISSEKAISNITKSLKNYTTEEVKDKTGNIFTIIKGEGGFVDISILQPFAEYIGRTGTKIYRGVAPAGEVLRNDKIKNSIMQEYQRKLAETKSGQLPQGQLKQRLQELNNAEKMLFNLEKTPNNESYVVNLAADAVDKQNMFVNKYRGILELANKVGITEGNKASEVIFKALDYRRAKPEEISALTPEQQKFIPIFRNAYKEIWQSTGKPSYEGIRDYATHLINDGLEKGYDISPLGRFLPDELYTRFFEKRKFGKPYQQDIVKAFDVYVPSVAKKIFREPVLQEANTIISYLNRDYQNELTDYMEAFLGRGRYKGEEPLGRLPRDLTRITYQGTLYGNISAASKNATQVLTNTIPEIGIKNVSYGYKRLMTPQGRQEFINSALSGEVTLGQPIDQLDFFSQVEFVNRGVTYLGAKQKALLEGKSLLNAEVYAKKMVRKTQFIQTGVDVPKLYRQYGAVGRAVGQFAQFPTKQTFLLADWTRNKEWGKLARFGTIAYLLGGTRAFPFLDHFVDKLPDDKKNAVRSVEKYTSLAGLTGMDIGQNFGFGIYSRGVPLGRGPAVGLVATEIPNFLKEVATGGIKLNDMQDIIRSRLVQKSLPTLIKGGVAMKKIIDLINLDQVDYQVRNAYNELQYISSPKEETLRVLVGPTKERKEAWESVSRARREDEIYRNEHKKMLDYTIDSKGDTLGLEEFLKKYPNYNIDNFSEELKNRVKTREIPVKTREFLRRPKALR